MACAQGPARRFAARQAAPRGGRAARGRAARLGEREAVALEEPRQAVLDRSCDRGTFVDERRVELYEARACPDPPVGILGRGDSADAHDRRAPAAGAIPPPPPSGARRPTRRNNRAHARSAASRSGGPERPPPSAARGCP